MQEVVAMQGTPQGVTGADARDGDVTPSRAVPVTFYGRERYMQASHNAGMLTKIFVTYSDGEFCVEFGDFQAAYRLWLSPKGIDAAIRALMAAKVQADIAHDVADGVPGTYVPRVHEDDVPW